VTDVLLGRYGTSRVGGRADAAVVRGRSRVFALLPDYDVLARRSGAPVTARASWIRALLVADPLANPWAAAVRGGDGRLRAAAILLDDGPSHAVLAAGGRGHRGAIPAVDGDDIALLGRRLAEEADLHGVGLRLGTLPDDDGTRGLAQALGASVELQPPIPAVAVTGDREILSYLSHGMTRTLRKARNRLASDGRGVTVRFTCQAAAVSAAMPAMERAYRSRDREHGLACPLDTPLGLARWRERIRHLLDDRCLELATLVVDGEFAAYVLGIRDGSVYRVLEGHFDTSWARYSPGRLLEASVLRRALADPAVETFDWMTSAAPESLLAANTGGTAVTLRRIPGTRWRHHGS
jgi:CelD/BcsL family acetyltransferase involved in cellulose biosynthesis